MVLPARYIPITAIDRHSQRVLIAWENAIMHIHGTTHIHGPHGINAPHAPFRSQGADKTATGSSVDRVDISPAAQAAASAAESSEIRQNLVDRIRAQIAQGTYETSQKLDAAVDRLLDEIG
jgi:flagellar biosynthesis anti-sigma factor FlgM